MSPQLQTNLDGKHIDERQHNLSLAPAEGERVGVRGQFLQTSLAPTSSPPSNGRSVTSAPGTFIR